MTTCLPLNNILNMFTLPFKRHVCLIPGILHKVEKSVSTSTDSQIRQLKIVLKITRWITNMENNVNINILESNVIHVNTLRFVLFVIELLLLYCHKIHYFT